MKVETVITPEMKKERMFPDLVIENFTTEILFALFLNDPIFLWDNIPLSLIFKMRQLTEKIINEEII